jgi:hypothetical protein
METKMVLVVGDKWWCWRFGFHMQLKLPAHRCDSANVDLIWCPPGRSRSGYARGWINP